jgi:hypothetical protein
VTQPNTEVSHLENLAAKLAQRNLTTQVIATGRRPYLRVASRDIPQLNERVFCDLGDDSTWRYLWPWRQPIGPVADIDAVIAKITAVLRPVEGQS